MKTCAAVVGALLVCASASSQLGEHPIEKVIGLLQGLAAKVEAEAKAEAISYTKFEYWCATSTKTLEKAIAEEKATIDALESKIEGKTKEEAALEEQIEALEAQIAESQAAQKKADDLRKEGAENYAEAEADLTATIAAVAEAIKILSEARDETDVLLQTPPVQKALQLFQLLATDAQRVALRAVLEQPAAAPAAARPDLKAAGEYEGHIKKYSFKSGSVIELLKGLLAQFESEKLEATKAETNALNAHSLASDARKNALDAAEASKGEKADTLAEVKAELAKAKADLLDTQEDLEADTGTLEATQKACKTKAEEWAERSAVREKELEAIAMAVKILAKVGGVRTEAPSNPVPPPSPLAAEEGPASFLQLAGSPKLRAVNFLRAEARVTHSKALERLAQEVAAHLSGPFDEVNNMVQKMIFRLMAEQKDEDDHKNWCDLELEKTNSSKINKEDKIEALSAKIDDAQATIQELMEEIKAANEMIADIDKHVAEATEIREIGKKENALALADAESAQNAVANAVSVLRDFYKNSGEVPKEPWEFLQGVELPENPATWDSSYTGVADPMAQPSGIITVLEGIGAEFATMEADTKAQEAMDKKAYDESMSECAIEKSRRTKETEVKTHEKKRLQDKVEAMTKQRKQISDELEAVVQYLKDLRPACVEGDSTYEDRKAARAKEIDALRQAQQILADAFNQPPPGAPAAAPVPANAIPAEPAMQFHLRRAGKPMRRH